MTVARRLVALGNRNSVAVSRRSFMKSAAATGALALGSGSLASCGEDDDEVRIPHTDLKPYHKAGIDWSAADGETITVAVVPADYFTNLYERLTEFTRLTGIDVVFDELPATDIRKIVVTDFQEGTGTYDLHAADPMYYPLYVANKWVEELDPYLDDDRLTNPDWFAYDDVFKIWRESTQVDGVTYGIPYDGEVTVQVYRTDLFDKYGLSPAKDLDTFRRNATEMHNPGSRVWGTALRGIAGAGQNMYIYPSLFRAWGGTWFDDSGNPTVNSDEGIEALEYYVSLLQDLAPRKNDLPGVQTGVFEWNWPEIADAFATGSLGSYIDAHSTLSVLLDPEKSVVWESLGFARWPEGPGGNRVTSIWNWSFPINASISDRKKVAAWLFVQWATSKETQSRTSFWFGGDAKRTGVNREPLWHQKAFREQLNAGVGFLDAALESLQQDTDINWRPRRPEWPEIGDGMAQLIHGALLGQRDPEDALDEANDKIEQILGA